MYVGTVQYIYVANLILFIVQVFLYAQGRSIHIHIHTCIHLLYTLYLRPLSQSSLSLGGGASISWGIANSVLF